MLKSIFVLQTQTLNLNTLIVLYNGSSVPKNNHWIGPILKEQNQTCDILFFLWKSVSKEWPFIGVKVHDPNVSHLSRNHCIYNIGFKQSKIQ